MSVASNDDPDGRALQPIQYDGHTVRNRLVYCPLCGHQFDRYEPRWKHFLDDHDPDDI